MKQSSRVVVFLGVFLVVAAGAVALPARGESGTPETKKEFERIKREMQEKKREIRKARNKEQSVLTALDRIDREILTGSAELAEQRKRLGQAEAARRELAANGDNLSRQLSGLKSVYALRLRVLYKMQRSGGAVINPAAGLGSLVKQVKYLHRIAERDRTIIENYDSALSRLRTQQASLSQTTAEILQRRKAFEAKKAELQSKRQQKSSILASVRRQKTLYEQTLHELEEASVNLWAMVRKDERERRPAAADRPPGGPRESGPAGETKGLPWPVEGRLLTRFGLQRHPQFGTMVFRRGIEIEAREGQTVHAVEGGEVAYADWYRGYGKLLILDHGNGFYTLYGNLSRLDLAKGDKVSRGQAIGLAGETGSMKGAKLYFEVRRKGEAEDPLLWLSKR